MNTVYVRFGWCLDGHCATCPGRSVDLACDHDCHKPPAPTEEKK